MLLLAARPPPAPVLLLAARSPLVLVLLLAAPTPTADQCRCRRRDEPRPPPVPLLAALPAARLPERQIVNKPMMSLLTRMYGPPTGRSHISAPTPGRVGASTQEVYSAVLGRPMRTPHVPASEPFPEFLDAVRDRPEEQPLNEWPFSHGVPHDTPRAWTDTVAMVQIADAAVQANVTPCSPRTLERVRKLVNDMAARVPGLATAGEGMILEARLEGC